MAASQLNSVVSIMNTNFILCFSKASYMATYLYRISGLIDDPFMHLCSIDARRFYTTMYHTIGPSLLKDHTNLKSIEKCADYR